MNTNFIGVKDTFAKAYRQFLNVPAPMTDEEKLVHSIHQAHREWRLAESRFNEATDHDLIDQAIYDMMAAKTKYTYLIRTAKDHNIRW